MVERPDDPHEAPDGLSEPKPPTPAVSPTKTRQPIIKDTMAGASDGAQGASAGRGDDDPETVLGCGDVLPSEVMRDGPACYRSGRANFSDSIEKPPKNTATSSCASICYTKPLHNRADDPPSNLGNHSRTRPRRCYTNALHIRAFGIVRRNDRFYYRRRVPASLRVALGKVEVWRSLGTDSLQILRVRRPK